MFFDLPPPPPKVWMPPKPAIIRPWKDTIAKAEAPQFESSFPFPSFVPGAALAPATVARDYAQNTGTPSGATHTVTGVPFNTAHANRIIVFAFGWNGSTAAFTSATIAGVGATAVCDGSAFASGLRFVIFYAPVPTGTSGTVVVNFNNACTGAVGVSWSVVYTNSGTHIAAAATTAAAGANISVNVNTLANSVMCGYGRGAQARTASGISANYLNVVTGSHCVHNSLIAAATPAAAGLNNPGSQVTSFGAVTFS